MHMGGVDPLVLTVGFGWLETTAGEIRLQMSKFDRPASCNLTEIRLARELVSHNWCGLEVMPVRKGGGAPGKTWSGLLGKHPLKQPGQG